MPINTPTIQSLTLTSPVILAPMAGISNLPYRRVMKSCGAGLVFTEMISANGLVRDGVKTRQLLVSHTDEYPLGIQLFGSDPAILAEAVTRFETPPELLDLNMGCPVKKVIRSGSGSALLREPRRIAAIIRAVRARFLGPLSIKIRSGWNTDNLNFLEVGQIAQDEGVDAITLHPRTRCQGFSGRANWEHIRTLKECLNIPVFGSGDITTAEEGIKMFEQTGCDGLMIGRGGYGNPWLIQHINALVSGDPVQQPDADDKLNMIKYHINLHQAQFEDRKTLLEMRKHVCWYARGMNGAGQLRSHIQRSRNLRELISLTEHFFLQDHQ